MSTTAGARSVVVTDAECGLSFPALVTYPAAAAEVPRRVGPYEISAAWDATPADGAFPLVVVSHGSGGSHLTHRGLAVHLARRGFVVALPEHPRNNRNDDSLAGTAELLARRPHDLRRAIDHAYAESTLAPHLVPDAVGVVGHSLGGYTALALAGGRPTAFAHETGDGRPAPVPVTSDQRVAALVLLAPATPWYLAPGALADVRVPILMRSAEHDPHTPRWHAELVARGVPATTSVDHRVVAHAGHFSFLAPFPAAMTAPSFPPSQDPPGFDRAAYHAVLYAEIEAFLRRALALRT